MAEAFKLGKTFGDLKRFDWIIDFRKGWVEDLRRPVTLEPIIAKDCSRLQWAT